MPLTALHAGRPATDGSTTTVSTIASTAVAVGMMKTMSDVITILFKVVFGPIACLVIGHDDRTFIDEWVHGHKITYAWHCRRCLRERWYER